MHDDSISIVLSREQQKNLVHHQPRKIGSHRNKIFLTSKSQSDSRRLAVSMTEMQASDPVYNKFPIMHLSTMHLQCNHNATAAIPDPQQNVYIANLPRRPLIVFHLLSNCFRQSKMDITSNCFQKAANLHYMDCTQKGKVFHYFGLWCQKMAVCNGQIVQESKDKYLEQDFCLFSN